MNGAQDSRHVFVPRDDILNICIVEQEHYFFACLTVCLRNFINVAEIAKTTLSYVPQIAISCVFMGHSVVNCCSLGVNTVMLTLLLMSLPPMLCTGLTLQTKTYSLAEVCTLMSAHLVCFGNVIEKWRVQITALV